LRRLGKYTREIVKPSPVRMTARDSNEAIPLSYDEVRIKTSIERSVVRYSICLFQTANND